MRTRFVVCSVLLAILAAMVVAGTASARVDREILKREVDLTGEERVDVHLSFGAGTLEVRKGRGEMVVRATLEFPEDAESPEFSYRKHGRAGELRIEAGEIEEWETDEEGVSINLDNEDWGDWWRAKNRNDWSISLTDRIPIALNLETGASGNDIDLTGLKLSDLEIEAGACELNLSVDEPSNYRTRVITIDSGATKLRAEGLGNLNFDRMEFNGGAGHFTLDFRGELDHRATVEINLGVGQLTIFVPRDIGIMIDASPSKLASVSVSGAFDEDNDVYVNDLYGKTDGEIVFEITASLATVNVESVR